MSNDEFYIGYQAKNSKGITRFVKTTIAILVLLFVFVALLWGLNQEKASGGKFELGNVIEIEGTFMEKPYPMLRIKGSQNIGKDVLLLGFGKFGAEKTLDQLNQSKLDGKQLKIKGTLIYYDGKTLFQIEPDAQANIQVLQNIGYSRKEQSLGSISMEGEVIDPKCYFGVMKPGHGKIHRSCGIRCIAGGIPPVFLVSNKDGTQDYLLIVDQNGNKINQQILDFVGKPVTAKGQVSKLGEWLVLKINPEKDIVSTNKKSIVY